MITNTLINPKSQLNTHFILLTLCCCPIHMHSHLYKLYLNKVANTNISILFIIEGFVH